MLGIIKTVVSGIAYTIYWVKDEQQEQRARNHSVQLGLPYYIDKRGRRRWTQTGKKQNPQEILKEKNDKLYKRKNNLKNVQLDHIIKKAKRDYELYIIHKDRLSFEEYLATSLPNNFYDEFIELREIKNNIPKERINQIINNRIFYG